jgi:hypothetical protein
VLDQAKVTFGSNNPIVQNEPQAATTSEEGVSEGEDAQGGNQPEDVSEEQSQDKDFTGVDKDKWEELLSKLDPDDFKYKM